MGIKRGFGDKLDQDQIERIKDIYRPKTKIVLDCMASDNPLKEGSIGQVVYVDNYGEIFVRWFDYNEVIGLLWGIDEFHIQKKEPQKKRKKTYDEKNKRHTYIY